MTYEYIRVIYDGIRAHTTDIRMTYKYIRVTYNWHANEMRMTRNFKTYKGFGAFRP